MLLDLFEHLLSIATKNGAKFVIRNPMQQFVIFFNVDDLIKHSVYSLINEILSDK